MPARFAPLALVLSVLLAVALPGCGGEGRRSGLFGPDEPLDATSIVVTRRRSAVNGDEALYQKLVLDLRTGRASLTDTDGRVYPVQFPPEAVEPIRTGIANRSWRVGERDPVKGAANPMVFTLTAYEGDDPIPGQAIWHRPTRNPLPPILAQIESALDRADRSAHPLSESVNLLD